MRRFPVNVKGFGAVQGMRGAIASIGLANARAELDRLLRTDGNTVAQYRADAGVTGSLAVSSWANQLGSAPALAQGTGANQPIYLPFSGGKYLYVSGVTGNYASTPDSGPVSITGDIDIRVYVALDDWTVTSGIFLAHDDTTGGNRGFSFNMGAGGCLRFLYWPDGTTTRSFLSTVAPGFSAGTWKWVRVTRSVSTGDINFYTSDNAVTWTKLGATVGSTVEGIFNSTAVLSVGASGNGAVGTMVGKIGRALLYNTIGGTTPAADLNPESSAETTTNGATWVASTGETWTLNCTGSKPAQIVGSSQLLFDGANHYMATGTFTFSQPCTYYLVFKQISWTANDQILAGFANATVLSQIGASPKLNMWNGSADVTESTGRLPLQTRDVVSVIFNGASSALQVGNNAATTGSPGTNNPSGITLAANYQTIVPANVQFSELIARNAADSAATRALIYQYLRAIYGTP